MAASKWIFLAYAVVGWTSCATPQRNRPPQEKQLIQAVSPPSRLLPPEHISGTAQAILKAHMASHAQSMGDLTTAIMVLHYDRIQEDAAAVAADASLSRPLTDDATELNSALPEKFFLYQDNLRLEAKTLSEAAARRSAIDIADSYGRLSQVCVRCHATYRAGR